jgi:nucleoside-diphosphate-sugar epimerase
MPEMKKVVVTGGSGKAGRAVVEELVEHGYQVLNADLAPPGERLAPFLKADLVEMGQAVEALEGAWAVVHLAAIPAPGMRTGEVTFRTNALSTYNVFAASRTLGLERVVWASSETTLGLPFDRQPPAYAPIDEEHPLWPQSSYALSKVVGEEMARHFSRWSGIPFVALRFSNVIAPEDYRAFPRYWKDPHARKGNLWGYVDVRDVAQGCRLGLEAPVQGAEAFIIAAADTVMNRPSRALMAEVFPGVPLREISGESDTLLSIGKARRLLGYAPRYSWRTELADRA